MTLSLALAALTGYAGLCLLVWSVQESLIYFPDRTVRVTPSDLGLTWRGVEIPTEDGQKLDAWLLPAGADRPWVLFCHGNAGNLSHRLGHALLLRRLGFNALFFDYRGYGKSTGRPTEGGVQKDADAAWRYLVEREHVDPKRLVLMGESLGGGVATGLASARPAAGLIVESTFTSAADLGAEVYPWLPVRWLSRNRFPSRERMATLAIPKLIMHGRDDEIIPFHHGQDLFAAAADPKEWLELPGGHNTGPLERGPAYAEALERFVNRAARTAESGSPPQSNG